MKHPPDVAHARVHAAEIVDSARRISGVDLDYTPASLELVDQILEGFREEGLGSDDVTETLWGFGCYLGEVLVRSGARWVDTPPEHKAHFGFPIVVGWGDGGLANPIGKVFKRVDDGEGEGLPHFYHVFSRPR